jgi:hypothetical protein
MNNYRSSYRRKSKKGKWIIVLILLSIAALKMYRNFGPAPTFADESKLATPVVEPDMEKTALNVIAQEPDEKTALNVISKETTSQVSVTDLPGAGVNPKSNPESQGSFNDIMASVETNPSAIVEAREKLNKMLSTAMSQQQLSLVQKELSELSEKWLFGRTVFPEDKLCGSYKVEDGDTAVAIGRKFKVPWEIIMKINNIDNPNMLRSGKTIKVINGPFHCRINRSTFTMNLFLQDTFVRSFTVGLGKSGMETPTGRWMVKQGGKLITPAWTDPDSGKRYEADDPDYPLGARWIALEGVDGDARGKTGFAIHGTKEPEHLGKASSRGCIRLENEEVKLVYDLLTPGLSQVEVE